MHNTVAPSISARGRGARGAATASATARSSLRTTAVRITRWLLDFANSPNELGGVETTSVLSKWRRDIIRLHQDRVDALWLRPEPRRPISWCRDVRATSNVGEAVGVLTSDMYASALVTNLWVAENQHASVCDSGRVGCYCSASRAPWADSDEVAVRPAGRHAVNFTATGRLLPTWGADAPAASLREGGRMVAAARCGCARGGGGDA